MGDFVERCWRAGDAEVRLLASESTWIEGNAVDQLRKTAALRGMKLAVGLPDLHAGKVSPIGAAFVAEGWIYPALVGSDIGCGVGLWRTGLDARKLKLDAWAERLRGLEDPCDDAREWLDARAIAPSGFETALGTIGGGNGTMSSFETRAKGTTCRSLRFCSQR